MNERIKELAEKAELDVDLFGKISEDDLFSGYSVQGIHENLERFAALVAADEREACAKLAEMAEPYQTADLIRARGQA